MLLQRAIANVKNARRLLARDDEDSLRYAALETRMAIEELFYALIPYYKEELPEDLLRRWQPRHIIDALLACNPMVEQYQQIVMRSKDDGRVIFAGHQTPATRELLKRYYQKLGSYLHAPLDGKERNQAKMRQFLEAALARIDEHCRQTTVIHNGGLYLQHRCVCGRIIKRNLFAVGLRRAVHCPDEVFSNLRCEDHQGRLGLAVAAHRVQMCQMPRQNARRNACHRRRQELSMYRLWSRVRRDVRASSDDSQSDSRAAGSRRSR